MLLYGTINYQGFNSMKLKAEQNLCLKNIVCKWQGKFDKDQLINFNKD